MDCKMLYMASHPTNHLGRQIIASRRLLHIPGVDRVISEASTVWHMSKDQRLGTKRTFFNRKPNCLFQDMQHHSVVWYSVDISSESVRLLQTNRCLPKHNLFTLPKSLILILKPRALPNTFPTKYTYVYIYIFHYIPRKFRQLSHFLSVSSYLSFQGTNDGSGNSSTSPLAADWIIRHLPKMDAFTEDGKAFPSRNKRIPVEKGTCSLTFGG